MSLYMKQCWTQTYHLPKNKQHVKQWLWVKSYIILVDFKSLPISCFIQTYKFLESNFIYSYFVKILSL